LIGETLFTPQLIFLGIEIDQPCKIADTLQINEGITRNIQLSQSTKTTHS